MNDTQTTRRRFLLAAVTFSSVATLLPGSSWLGYSTAWADAGEDEISDDLVGLARLLFPHDGLADSTYAKVLGSVLATLAANTETAELVDDLGAMLDQRRDRPWSDLDEPEQLTVMQEIQGEALFTGILESVRFAFYYHPQVWEHIGYPGSSREFGGYIHRGFDDIDWLPGDA